MHPLNRNGEHYYDPTAFEAIMNITKESEPKMEIYRGDIFFVKNFPGNVDSEQFPGRPAIIVSNNSGNLFSNNVEVVYLTTQEKKPLPTHVPIVCKGQSTALCENIHTISKTRLDNFIRCCTTEEMRQIDKALMISLGIQGGEGSESVEKLKSEHAESIAKLEADYSEKIRKLEAELKESKNRCEGVSDGAASALLKVTTERDLFKDLYNEMLVKIMAKEG